MPRKIVRGLTSLDAKRINKRGMHADGSNLYLSVAKNGSRSWIFRYRLGNRRRHLGLGPVDQVPLAEARKRADAARRQLYDGVDPVEARREKRVASRLAAARSVTFRSCVEHYVAAHRAGWRSAKHATQWATTLETYAYPTLGALPVHAIGSREVLSVLSPIWVEKAVTASRLRGRIEKVINFARAHSWREGDDNPARWSVLSPLLPEKNKVAQVKHFGAVPVDEIPTFTATLRSQQGMAALALQFTLLTAARSSEALGARWCEIDLDDATWTVPAERTKAMRSHRVPLGGDALDLLRALPGLRDGELVFPSVRGKVLPSVAMSRVMKACGYPTATVHGLRSSFRDWVAEKTSFPGEVAEAALAHVVADRTEAAYRRTTLFARRAEMMQAWANYCGGGAGASVLPLVRTSALTR
jgi:integrase